MASIHLPCGCHINDAFVIGMCPKHYGEYREKVAEEEEAFRAFARLCDERSRSSATSELKP